jgi:hypothetical protein
LADIALDGLLQQMNKGFKDSRGRVIKWSASACWSKAEIPLCGRSAGLMRSRAAEPALSGRAFMTMDY